jgi:hypothetical protein
MDYIDDWNWYYISIRASMKDVRKYPNKPWDITRLSSNKNITIDVVYMDFPNATGAWGWDWECISENIKMEDIINNPNETWCRELLSHNKNICIDVVKMNLPNATGYWNWDAISENIKMEDVIRYPNEKWNRYSLSSNNNTTIEVVHMNLPNAIEEWDWYYLSECIDIKNVFRYPNETWSRNGLSMNKKIIMDVINMDLPNATGEWKWRYISTYISMEDLIRYPNEKWDMVGLYQNKELYGMVDIILSRENIDKRIQESRIQSLVRFHDILSCIRYEGKEDVSNHKRLSVDMIEMVDRVGMCMSKWKNDIDIVCMY